MSETSSFLLSILVVGTTIAVLQCDAMVYKEQLDLEDLESIFGEDECIDGTISVSDTGTIGHSGSFTETAGFTPKENSTLTEVVEENSPMSQINELSMYNKISYLYTLTGEAGPSHSKLFTVSLALGEEEYVGEGRSIKSAQHSAANLALKNTHYNHPAPKSKFQDSHKINKNLAHKLEKFVNKRWDTSVKYTYHGQSSHNTLNHHSNYYHKNMYSKPDVYKVTVQIGQFEFIGEALSKEKAKEKAASNALVELQQLDGFCTFDNEQISIFQNSDESPISFLNEFASKSKPPVNFEIVEEEGPPHMKMFTIKCSVGNKFKSYGKGTSKKAAKRDAASNILNILESHSVTTGVNCGNLNRKTRQGKPRKEIKLLKSTMNIDNKENSFGLHLDINPISKLMQLTHGTEPIFSLLEERRENSKQFSVQVKVGDLVYVGYGPNKKKAKRKAAEGMLKLLGYSENTNRYFRSRQKRKESKTPSPNEAKKMLSPGLSLNSKSFNSNEHFTENLDTKSNEVNENKEIKKSKSDSSTKREDSSKFKSSISELDRISHILNIKYQFSDFPLKNNSGFVTLLSLTTHPPTICYATGNSNVMSQENSAYSAIKNLYKSHIHTITLALREQDIDEIKETFGGHEEIMTRST